LISPFSFSVSSDSSKLTDLSIETNQELFADSEISSQSFFDVLVQSPSSGFRKSKYAHAASKRRYAQIHFEIIMEFTSTELFLDETITNPNFEYA